MTLRAPPTPPLRHARTKARQLSHHFHSSVSDPPAPLSLPPHLPCHSAAIARHTRGPGPAHHPATAPAKWTTRSIERPRGRPGARRGGAGGDCERTGGDRENPSHVLPRSANTTLPLTGPPHRSAQLSSRHRSMQHLSGTIGAEHAHTEVAFSLSPHLFKQCSPRRHKGLSSQALLRLAHRGHSFLAHDPPLLALGVVTPSSPIQSVTPSSPMLCLSCLIESWPSPSTCTRSDSWRKSRREAPIH
jgi:hypothetical protein